MGPVYATPTKEGRPAVGLELVRYAAEHARMPWFAIGGIDAGNVTDVVGAGATRIAVVRAIGDADDPEQAARALRLALPPRQALLVLLPDQQVGRDVQPGEGARGVEVLGEVAGPGDDLEGRA